LINDSPRLVAAAVLLAAASCAISEGKRGCAQSSDCLLGRVCNAGVCEDPKVVAGAAGAETGGESGDDTAGGGERQSPQGGGTAGGGTAGGGGRPVTGSGGESGENESSSGGPSSGTSGEAGAAGSESPTQCDPNEVPVVVNCFSHAEYPPYPVARARGLATLGVVVPPNRGIYVMAADAKSDTVALTWMNASYELYDLVCFDAFPSPARGAGLMLKNGSPEWFMTARCGTLFQRTLLDSPFGWTAWTNVTLPPSVPSVTDVAATLAPDGTNILYASGGGRVVARLRSGDTYAPYGPWREVASDTGPLLAAATRADGRQQIFTLDESGRPLTNRQQTTSLDAAFEGWSDFGSTDLPALIEIESPSGLNKVEVYALDADHGLWTREEDGNGDFTPWTPWSEGSAEFGFSELSGASVPGEPAGVPFLMVGSAPSGVFTKRRVDGTWDANWERLR
jgi:hypothetical protein